MGWVGVENLTAQIENPSPVRPEGDPGHRVPAPEAAWGHTEANSFNRKFVGDNSAFVVSGEYCHGIVHENIPFTLDSR